MVDRVLFDTTTLCSAFLNPEGLDMQLLQLARVGVVEPILTQEVVAEWMRVAMAGRLDGVRYDNEDLDAFGELIEPLLSSAMIRRVRVGRAQGPLYPLIQEGGVFIVQHPARGFAETKTRMLDTRTLALKDHGDLHLVVAALYHGCDYLCTYNTKDFPDGLDIAGVRCVRPETLMTIVRHVEEGE